MLNLLEGVVSMKFFKTLLTIICNILMLPLSLVAMSGAMWYILPAYQTTKIGTVITGILSAKSIFWITIISAAALVIFYVLQLIFSKDLSAKLKNFFIHLNTWLLFILCVTISIETFILVEPLQADSVIIAAPRKISIGICLGLLIIFHMFSGKVMKIINRRIQAYENAKETNLYGRSSVIMTNLLKVFELFFPELIVLLLLCFCVSWNVSQFFIIILASCAFPLLGNIISDFNIKREIRRKERIEKDLLAKKVAENMKGDK